MTSKQKMIEETKKDFEGKFYEGEENCVMCGEHNLSATPTEMQQFIKSRLSKAYDAGVKDALEATKVKIGERMELEKYRAEVAETEKPYKHGKYVGLRTALEILDRLRKEFLDSLEKPDV